MKKTILGIALMAAFGIAKADEGMWTLYNLPQAVYQQMKLEGFQLPYDDLYKSKDAVKNAVVNFSGFCSGVVVSPDGLVFTNHHCGFEAIRSHSTVEHDYMLNGFVAQSFADELPCKDTFVSFMLSQQDVTSRLEKLGLHQLSKSKQAALIDSLQNAMTDSVKKTDATLHVDIAAFYEATSIMLLFTATLPTFGWSLLYLSRWENLVERPTTGCGRVKLATFPYSVFTPIPRPTDLQRMPKRMFPTVRSTGHRYR